MDIRYSTGKEPFKRMTTEELREEFLITGIFKADDVSAVYSHVDRIVTMGAMPVKESDNIKIFVHPTKPHSSCIKNMPKDKKKEIISILDEWLGEQAK